MLVLSRKPGEAFQVGTVHIQLVGRVEKEGKHEGKLQIEVWTDEYSGQNAYLEEGMDREIVGGVVLKWLSSDGRRQFKIGIDAHEVFEVIRVDEWREEQEEDEFAWMYK